MKKYLPLIAAGFMSVALAKAPPFAEVDTNSDGEISEEELTVVKWMEIVKCDTNQDEYLSPREYAACIKGDKQGSGDTN